MTFYLNYTVFLLSYQWMLDCRHSVKAGVKRWLSLRRRWAAVPYSQCLNSKPFMYKYFWKSSFIIWLAQLTRLEWQFVLKDGLTYVLLYILKRFRKWQSDILAICRSSKSENKSLFLRDFGCASEFSIGFLN